MVSRCKESVCMVLSRDLVKKMDPWAGEKTNELFSEHSVQRIARHPSCSQWLVRRVRDGLQV